MRIPRVHVDQPLAPNREVQLDSRATEHLLRVLRLRAGDRLTLFNGDGIDYPAQLTVASRHAAQARIAARIDNAAESPLELVLVQAMVSGNKMDWVIQKAVELGVSRIVPLVTERCNVRLDDKRTERRRQHWRGVVLSACEQCGRARIPDITDLCSVSEWCQRAAKTDALHLALLPGAKARMRDLEPTTSASLVVGPEGGLSEAEARQLEDTGHVGLSLGPRILRTETAGLATLAALQSHFGDA